MSISDKLVQIASNLQRVFDAGHDSIKLQKKTVRINRNGWYYPKVDEGYDGIGSLQIQVNTPQDNYEAGKQAEYDKFWDNFQNYGNRRYYRVTFNGNQFNAETFFPKYDIIVEGSGYQMMYAWNSNEGGMPKIPLNLKQRLIDCGVTLDTSSATNLDSMFSYGNITHIPTIDCSGLPNGVATGLFSYCWGHLKYIEKIIVHEGIEFKNWFTSDTGLESITIEGIIGQAGFDVSPCTKLTHESLMSIINALQRYDGDGKTHTVTLGQANISKLSEQEIAFATQKGWTIA